MTTANYESQAVQIIVDSSMSAASTFTLWYICEHIHMLLLYNICVYIHMLLLYNICVHIHNILCCYCITINKNFCLAHGEILLESKMFHLSNMSP